MPLTRKQTWPSDLLQFIEQRKAQPFVWGTNDCCLFAADAVQSITGIDVADDFRDSLGIAKYSDQLSAFKLIQSVTGGTTVADAAAYCATKHGLTEWLSWKYAKRGDLVVIAEADQLIAGVVHHDGMCAVSVGEDGLRLFPLSQVTRAWKV